ncbi:MAG: preprotein translocase subunit SecE [Eggerthellaceae bacterium]|nr:preprotein translocase subunit SecE [Eggerthellaceae bacterium]
MAKKSKTQKAKASAARAQKKVEQESKALEEASEASKKIAQAQQAQPEKKGLFKKAEATPEPAPKPASEKKQEKKIAKKEEKKHEPRKGLLGFLYNVRGEMRRVTWPGRQDVLRWSMVVVGALVFFGLFTLVLDRVFAQLLPMISGLGA